MVTSAMRAREPCPQIEVKESVLGKTESGQDG